MAENAGDDRLEIVAEEIHVDKRLVESDRVRIRTVVDTREVLVEDSVQRQTIDVERVAFDREIGAPPPPREEGDMIVISLVEERIVTEKRLFLIEEVRVRKTAYSEAISVPMTVRAMRAVIDHAGIETMKEETHG